MPVRPSLAFAANRHLIRQVVEAHRARNPRVFGSVPRGEDADGSDLDVLVDAAEGATLFDIAAMELALEQLLGVPVHVVSSGALQGALRERVLAQAKPI